MSSFFTKYVRGAVLGLMLLLAGAANMVCLSYDIDDDEDTPPVTVELYAASPEALQEARGHVVRHRSTNVADQFSAETSSEAAMASLHYDSVPRLTENSAQLIMPLRR